MLALMALSAHVGTLTFLATSLAAAGGAAQPAAPAPGGWVPLGAGALVRVEAERALYQQTGAPHFYVHIRVTNLTARPLGLDTRTRELTVYPNQWGRGDLPNRVAVDE